MGLADRGFVVVVEGGGNEQMFGANQQVPRAGGSYKEAETAAPAQFLLPSAKLARPVAG